MLTAIHTTSSGSLTPILDKPFKTPPMVILNRRQKPKTAKADEHDCESILKALDAKRVPVGDKVKYWLDNNIVGNKQELNSQATDDFFSLYKFVHSLNREQVQGETN